MERNDSSIDLYQKVKNDNYHLGQLNRPVSQIDLQRNMVGFVMDGHIWWFPDNLLFFCLVCRLA